MVGGSGIVNAVGMRLARRVGEATAAGAAYRGVLRQAGVDQLADRGRGLVLWPILSASTDRGM
jgi:hypothetical protein